MATKDFRNCGFLRFSIGMILVIFELQDTLILSTRFQVNWPFGSEEEALNTFSRGRSWRASWTSDRKDLAIFNLKLVPIRPTSFRVDWPFGSGEEVQNRF